MAGIETRGKAEGATGALQGKEKPALVFMAGASGSGKTTVVAKLLPRLQALGLKVAVVKHACHLQLDPEKDSTRYLQEGASLVAAVSPQTVQVLAAPAQEPDLEEVLHTIWQAPGVDLILVEGYKNSKRTKVEVLRQAVGAQLRAPAEELLCVVTDIPQAVPDNVPAFGFGEEEKLAIVVFQWYLDERNRLARL